MNIKLAGKVNILIIVGFPGLHAGSQGFFKTQVGRPVFGMKVFVAPHHLNKSAILMTSESL